MRQLTLMVWCVVSVAGCLDSPTEEILNEKGSGSETGDNSPSDNGEDGTGTISEETDTAGETAAGPSTNAETPGGGNRVAWETETVMLTADDFYLDANGVRFFADVEDVNIQSDPGLSDYTTLELIWHENGVEMRLFIYFTADGNAWWANEIRTYSGPKTPTDWLYYTGEFFLAPLDAPYQGNVDLTADEDNDFKGRLHFENLTLTVTFSG